NNGGSGDYATDMKHYCDSVDIISAGYYAITDPYEPSKEHGVWAYGRVIDDIRLFCGPSQNAMGFVETSHPFSVPENAANSYITPDQVEGAVWSIVVHGGNGFIYFAHHFNDKGIVDEDALLLDSTMKARVASVDAAVAAIAPVLNSLSQQG